MHGVKSLTTNKPKAFHLEKTEFLIMFPCFETPRLSKYCISIYEIEFQFIRNRRNSVSPRPQRVWFVVNCYVNSIKHFFLHICCCVVSKQVGDLFMPRDARHKGNSFPLALFDILACAKRLFRA